MTAAAHATFGLFSASALADRRALARAGRPRILAVAADEYTRELMRLCLSQAGYSVRVAPDAIAGGNQVLEGAPDLLITEIGMPHLSGLDLVVAARADPAIPYFPVIFLGAGESADRAEALGVPFLAKPISADRLLQAVRAATS